MKNLSTVLATAACLAAGSAQAQQWDPATFEKSTEMMIPHLLVSTVLGPSSRMPGASVTAMDANDRRAAEVMRRTDMMMPEMAQPRVTGEPHALTAMPGESRSATQMSADDRRVAERIRRTDQMRPD